MRKKRPYDGKKQCDVDTDRPAFAFLPSDCVCVVLVLKNARRYFTHWDKLLSTFCAEYPSEISRVKKAQRRHASAKYYAVMLALLSTTLTSSFLCYSASYNAAVTVKHLWA